MNIAALPKAELHCHLDGILDSAIARLIHAEDPSCPVDIAAMEAAYPIRGVEAFFQWFGFVTPVESKIEYLCLLADQHIARLKAQQVRYAEWLLPAGAFGVGIGQAEALARVGALREWVDRTQNDDIEIAFTIGVGRNKPPEVIAQFAGPLLALHEAGLIVGIGVAGPEAGYPVQPFTRTLAQLHEAGIGIEVHAGEWCGPASVWDALEYGYPDRIGHGVALFQDARLVELFQERQIHIEMCPTSNFCTGSVARIEDHPIGRARELGLNFSVNTDDPGAFECSMNSEYQLLADVFGFQEADFATLYQNTLNARFLSNSTRI